MQTTMVRELRGAARPNRPTRDNRTSTYPPERTRPGKGVRVAVALAFAPLLLLGGCASPITLDLTGTTWLVTSVDDVELTGVRSMVSFNQGEELTSLQIYTGCAVIGEQRPDFLEPDWEFGPPYYWEWSFSEPPAATGCSGFLSAESEELNLSAFRQVRSWRVIDQDHIELSGAHVARLARVTW